MYVLLVAFRIDRLVRRTDEEEEFMLDLMEKALYWRTIYQRDVEAVIGEWQDLDKKTREKVENIVIEKGIEYRSLHTMGKGLAEYNEKLFCKLIDDEIKDESKIKKCAADLLAGKVMTEVMEEINKDKSEEELSNAYHFSIMAINRIEEWEIEKANSKEKTSDTDERILELKKFQTDFTKFINSRQQGNNLSELIAIGVIGFALVALMNLGFPEGIRGYGAFSVHLFTLFTSTIVVFLFFNILDLGNDRNRSLHDVGPGDSDLWKNTVHWIYESPDPRWIVTVSAVTTIVYVWLLWDKLVSPFPFLY